MFCDTETCIRHMYRHRAYCLCHTPVEASPSDTYSDPSPSSPRDGGVATAGFVVKIGGAEWVEPRSEWVDPCPDWTVPLDL